MVINIKYGQNKNRIAVFNLEETSTILDAANLVAKIVGIQGAKQDFGILKNGVELGLNSLVGEVLVQNETLTLIDKVRGLKKYPDEAPSIYEILTNVLLPKLKEDLKREIKEELKNEPKSIKAGN